MAETNETPNQEDLVQCEVTGQWVTEDEIITIQGRRVCAEGKAELLERLKSGESMPGELERPAAFRRFACMFVDGLVLGLAGIILGFLFLGPAFFTAYAQQGTGGTVAMGIGLTLLQLANTGIAVAYYTLMHGRTGQTLGKMAGKIKVVKADGTPITTQIAFARIFYLYAPTYVAAVLMPIAVLTQSPYLTVGANIVNGLGGMYIIASVIVALVDRDQQRSIHDRLAKTRVIRIN